jgi:hypothetical protein
MSNALQQLTSNNKQTFLDVVPEIVAQFGIHVKRVDIMGFCNSRRISVPPFNSKLKVAHGVWNLEPFMRELKRPIPIPISVSTNGLEVSSEDNFSGYHNVHVDLEDKRTDKEIEDAITEHFETASMIIDGLIQGDSFAAILSGNPGIGKTYNTEIALELAAADETIEYEIQKGYTRATGLLRLLYKNRAPNKVVLIDDMDSVFQDVVGLNLLKAALDTKKVRKISWLSEKQFETEDGEVIPKTFTYEGRIIFITNINFEDEVRRHNKASEHLLALMSRCDYIDLNLPTQRELMIRIKSVIKNTEILTASGLKKESQAAIVKFLEDYKDEVRELSLRTVARLVKTMISAKEDLTKFSQMAKMTSFSRDRRHF